MQGVSVLQGEGGEEVRFLEAFSLIDSSLGESSFVFLHWIINDMDNSISEIDVYDPGTFMQIAR